MGTRSIIAKETDKGFESIYCHWDGYVEHNGKILKEHYQDPNKVDELIDLGDISSLGDEIGEKHDFDDHDPKVVTAYHRDRGENPEDVAKRFSATLDDLMQSARGYGAEFFYVFSKDGNWKYSPVSFYEALMSVLRSF